MKKYLLSFILLAVSTSTYSQFSHSINFDYSFPFYFDGNAFRKSLHGGANYRALYRNNGMEVFFKYVDVSYGNSPFANGGLIKVPDSTLYFRISALGGANFVHKINLIKDQLFLFPAIGIAYLHGSDLYLESYTQSGEFVLDRYRISRLVSVLGFKIEKLLLQKFNFYGGAYYYRSPVNDSQNHILTIDIGLGYNLNRYKKNL